MEIFTVYSTNNCFTKTNFRQKAEFPNTDLVHLRKTAAAL